MNKVRTSIGFGLDGRRLALHLAIQKIKQTEMMLTTVCRFKRWKNRNNVKSVNSKSERPFATRMKHTMRPALHNRRSLITTITEERHAFQHHHGEKQRRREKEIHVKMSLKFEQWRSMHGSEMKKHEKSHDSFLVHVSPFGPKRRGRAECGVPMLQWKKSKVTLPAVKHIHRPKHTP